MVKLVQKLCLHPTGKAVFSIGMNALLRHELLLLWGNTQASCKRLSDILALFIGLPVLILVARSWFATLPPGTASLLSLSAGLGAGYGITQVVGARAVYHRTVGILPEHALETRVAIPSFAALVFVGLLPILAIAFAIHQPSAVQFAIAATGGILAKFALLALFEGGGRNTAFTSWIRDAFYRLSGVRPALILGGSCGLLAALAYLTSGNEIGLSLAIAAILLAMLLLTGVDAKAVHFMAISGHSPWQTVRHYLRAPSLFVLAALPICLAAGTMISAVAVVGIAAPTMTLQLLRILSYRLYPKMLAEFTVGMLCLAVSIVAMALPIAAPAVLVLAIWWLWAKGRALQWRLA